MTRVLIGTLVVIFVIGLIGCGQLSGSKSGAKQAFTPSPNVTMGTPMVEMDKKAKAVIMGAGFEPGQEVQIIVTDVDGVQSDIGYALEPAPKANAVGAWATTWNCGRYIAKDLIKDGAYLITVTDSDYNTLAVTPVTFYKAKDKDKEKKKKD